MITRNELKQIRDGVSMNAPNAPTLAEMEMESYLAGGREKVQLVGGSPNAAIEVKLVIEVEEAQFVDGIEKLPPL
jgi:hypothetical protein